jgi:hypothetical protein
MTARGIWSVFGSNPTTVLSTELNSLGIGAMSVAGPTYNNQSNLDLYCDIEVFLTAYSPAATLPYVAIYILAAIDGTNFPGQSAADLRLTNSQLFCVIPIGSTASTAQRVAARNLILPPQPVQFRLDNQTGTAFAATLNTVKIDAYSYNNNG